MFVRETEDLAERLEGKRVELLNSVGQRGGIAGIDFDAKLCQSAEQRLRETVA